MIGRGPGSLLPYLLQAFRCVLPPPVPVKRRLGHFYVFVTSFYTQPLCARRAGGYLCCPQPCFRMNVRFALPRPFPFRLVFFALGAMASGVVLVQIGWNRLERNNAPLPPPSDKVNLALRRTAHQLLIGAGDSTSRIPPVEQTDAHVWRVQLARDFRYEQLPTVLQGAFEAHHIARDYDVAVRNCSDGTLMLGYTLLDLDAELPVPCSNRELPPNCYYLEVTFAAAPAPRPLPWLGWLAGALLGLGVYALGQRRPAPPEADPAPVGAAPDGDWLAFGHSRLDVGNLLLACGQTTHKLTYREAKLLHLFARHPNQVLERAVILEKVWADEGVVVGRSVDMFVSRLRKLLREDPSVQLVAVHGVGYRMEVTSPTGPLS